jgi:hypothetical protein
MKLAIKCCFAFLSDFLADVFSRIQSISPHQSQSANNPGRRIEPDISRVPPMSGYRHWTLCIVLLAMTVLAYHSLWQNDFIDFDDEHLITNNPHVIQGLTHEGIRWAWSNHEAPYWMPITWLSFLFDAQVSAFFPTATHARLNPAVFHGQNLFWHVCNVEIFFALMLRLTGRTWRSFLVAALFAIHPMHVESVAWASERKDVLMCFFGLVSLSCHVRFVETRSRTAYAAMLVSYQASLMCKPMLLTLPFVLLLLDYWPLCRVNTRSSTSLGEQKFSVRSLILEKLPLFLVALTMAGHTVATRPGNPMPDLGMFDRTMNAFSGYASYLCKTFYPNHLAVFYPHPGSNWSVFQSLVGVSLTFSLTGLALWRANRRRWFVVGWLWFVVTLVPVIGLTQGGYQAWADRFTYWPHIGLFIAIVWGATEAAHRLHFPPLLCGGVWTTILAGFMVLTCLQVGYWKSSTLLWEHAVEVTERNDRAHQHLAIRFRREDRIMEAEFHLLEATRIQGERRGQSFRLETSSQH